ncbi:MAG: ribonuclease P protein component [Candidatus Nanopelagicales bacterium]
MLPAPHRLRRGDDIRRTVRRGRRASRGVLVVHLHTDPDAHPAAPARAAFVTGRSVGSSVVRHRVTRRLRELVRARLDRVPAGSRLVVRALPDAATADSARMGADLDAALAAVLTPASATAGRSGS